MGYLSVLNLDETVEPNGSGAAGEGYDGNLAKTSLIYLENRQYLSTDLTEYAQLTAEIFGRRA